MMASKQRLTALIGSVLLLTTLLVVSAATVSAAAVDLSIDKGVIALPHLRGFAIAGEELIYEIRMHNSSNDQEVGHQFLPVRSRPHFQDQPDSVVAKPDRSTRR
jgi:hypothetical protein